MRPATVVVNGEQASQGLADKLSLDLEAVVHKRMLP